MSIALCVCKSLKYVINGGILKFWLNSVCKRKGSFKAKADPGLSQDIAYIYEILQYNHFIILSNATAYETTQINEATSPLLSPGVLSEPPQGWDTDWL